MAVALPRVDAGGGGFERRVLAAAADVRLVPPDSVAALPMSMRGRIGVFLVLGYLHEHSHAKRLIDRAIAELHRLGYRAAILDVAPRQPVAADADRLLDGIRRELEHVDRAILVGFSKGACAISWMLLESAGELTRRQRAKIGAVITVAGVVRGSCFARWMGDRETPDTLALKLLINLKSRAPVARFDDLRSLRADPWAARPRGSLGQAFPGLTWISYAVLPDGPDGHVRSHALFGCISRAAGRRAGVEFMDTLLRSLPRRWVWAGG